MTQTLRQRSRTTTPELPNGEISLQSPPVLPKGSGQGATQLMFMLPMMLGMGAMSFVYIGRSGGPMTYVFGALYASAMVGMVVMSMSRGGAQKRAQINDERRDYQRYLSSLRVRVREVADTQRSQLAAQHPAPGELWSFVASTRLWERRRSDSDFGQLRIGLGPQRLVTPLRAPQTVPLEDLDPVSSTALRHFIRTYSTVDDLPVALSLRSLSHIELSGERGIVLATARALIAQASTFHGPWDLRIALCVAPDRVADWQWLKWLPQLTHSNESDAVGPRRLVAGDSQELVGMLGAELGDRPVFSRQSGRAAAEQPQILVIVDGGLIGAESALTPEFGRQGVSVLDLSYSGPMREPRPGLAGIYLTEDRMGMVTEEGLALLGKPDQLSVAEAEALARQMCPLYTVAPSSTDTPLTSNLGLPGLLGLGDPRDVDPAVTWRRRSARERLRIPIGIDPEGRPVELDLKESAESGMGPHGLVIGATGSGKSELLRTLVIGLAVTHSSETLNFALIDFKGGATFAGLAELPHVSAVITNLSDDLAMVDRMADAISGEVVRRQELLRAAGNYASVRDYERARESGVQLSPLPSLLVIIDEFSELLSSRPEFIDLFVMIGRLGRSLGIHLLLASQRLEEGRLRGLDSHLSYRVGLRTFSAAESRAVLGVADAYELPSIPGSAFLKIDTSTLIRLKAAFVSGALPPRRSGDSGARRNSAVLPFGLEPVIGPNREIEAADENALAAAEEQTGEFAEGVVVQNSSIADTLVSAMLGKGPAGHQIWLPPLGAPPSLDQLLPPLGIDPERGLTSVGWAGNGRLTVPLAVVDKPFEQRRDLLWADLSGAAGNAVVAGGPQTGKSTMMRTLVSALALTHTPEEVQFFLLDMGGGALASLAGLPHTSGYASRLDAGTCRRIVAEVATLLTEREQQFNAAGIDSVAAFRARRAELAAAARAANPGARIFGDVFLVIDGFATFRQEFEALEDIIGDIAARGLGYGIHLVLSTTRWTTVKAQVRDMLGTRFELALGDPADSMIDRKASANIPTGKPGRGVTQDRLHFLTALPRLDSQSDPATVAAGAAELVTQVRQAWTGPPAPPVRLLPSVIRLDSLPASPGKNIPIGIAESNLEPVSLDFGVDPHFLAFADVESGKTSLLRTIAHGIMDRYTADEVAIIVADYRRGLLDVVSGRHLLGYAGSEPVLSGLISEVAQAMRARIPGPDVTAEQLRARNWWSGPELFLIIDDYDLVAASGSNPMLSLVEFLPQARDIGLHVVLARATGGAGRGLYEPVVQRLRELGSPGLVMSGSKDEGILLGNVKLAPLPPGRGTLVSRRAGAHFMQVAWTDLPELPRPTEPAPPAESPSTELPLAESPLAELPPPGSLPPPELPPSSEPPPADLPSGEQ